ncbi:hypothetical protein K491DRAFT_712708 [Lophiostoma macrostomum CBS 122681]|uniref:Uncharacterized protein n=1 Tax=Lophiostoma macrostomum CBS 122681 TaxID=1314788 RepID=A0A6A6TI76_9PLEO|nr:hypothetical protein K491DRAFT_712708 [Lophiostoma macrostomum CBS 122681]
MLISNQVWSAYGIVVDSREQCQDCTTPLLASTLYSNWSATMTTHSSTASATSTDFAYSTVLAQGVSTIAQEQTSAVATSTVSASSTFIPPVPTAKQTQNLSNDAKIGLGVSLGVLGFALALVVMVDWFYLRRRRQERALVNALQEVERGEFKGSEERMVLESRVSIVFDVDTSDEEEEERGRHGMSLPRRV